MGSSLGVLSNIAKLMRVNKFSPNAQTTEFMIKRHPLKMRYLEFPETQGLNGLDI